MGSLLVPLLSLLLVATSCGGGSLRRRQVELAQGPESSRPPAPLGASRPFRVRLSPESVAVRPGDAVWLNCSDSCPGPASASLLTPLRRGSTLRGPGWESYQLREVTAWSSLARCVVTCEGQTRQATARINAYQRPRSVILEPPVLEGRRYTLRCHVTHVFPVGFLVISLRRGSRVIYLESLERFKGLDMANVTLTYTLRPRPSDLGQPVTCHARLSLDILTELGRPPGSRAWASSSIAALLGILLVVGVTYLHKYGAMWAPAESQRVL